MDHIIGASMDRIYECISIANTLKSRSGVKEKPGIKKWTEPKMCTNGSMPISIFSV